MSNIKVGDRVEVINTGIFGYRIQEGDVGVVKDIVDNIEIAVYFGDFPSGLIQWVHYPTWERWVKVIKE